MYFFGFQILKYKLSNAKDNFFYETKKMIY